MHEGQELSAALPASDKAVMGGLRARVKQYYRLTKPGIVYSNTLTAVAGYLFASKWHIDVVTLLCLTFGTLHLIASACVYNNYMDRGIDVKMRRTSRRALVTGVISGRHALVYATLLGLIGFTILCYTNRLTVIIGLSAVFGYVVVYGIAKRRTAHATLIGTLPGAASLVAGYTAVVGHLDMVALLLFLIMLAWQMPHFYAIAIRRKDDYAAAGLPVWPVRYGVHSTAAQMVAYCVLFTGAICMMTILGYTGYMFVIIMGVLGIWWFWLACQGFRAANSLWARKAFFFSLIVLLAFIFTLPLGAILP